jgi:ubiquinone/menaquinone biosynthesis C-methylase UbiE
MHPTSGGGLSHGDITSSLPARSVARSESGRVRRRTMGQQRYVPLSHDEAVLARARVFDEWTSRFAGLIDLGMKLHPLWGPRLRKAAAQVRGPRVLEVSFGTGYLMSLYAGRFQTTGIDYNPRMIETTRRRLDRLGLHADLIQADAHALPFDDQSFDCVVNTDAFTMYADPQQAMSEFHRVLVPGGRLVLCEYDRPADRNWLGMQWIRLAAKLGMPGVDFDPLLRSIGFEYEDHAVGLSGVLHMFVGTKPDGALLSERPPQLMASETAATPDQS